VERACRMYKGGHHPNLSSAASLWHGPAALTRAWMERKRPPYPSLDATLAGLMTNGYKDTAGHTALEHSQKKTHLS
jgi:hypothetical protein